MNTSKKIHLNWPIINFNLPVKGLITLIGNFWNYSPVHKNALAEDLLFYLFLFLNTSFPKLNANQTCLLLNLQFFYEWATAMVYADKPRSCTFSFLKFGSQVQASNIYWSTSTLCFSSLLATIAFLNCHRFITSHYTEKETYSY